MKATGIVRRIDELGRVVVPKEIRRRLKIKDGDPMEIYIDGEAVIFKRYRQDMPETRIFDAATDMELALEEIYDNKAKNVDYDLLKSFILYIKQQYEAE